MAEINTVIAEASQDLQTIEDFVNLPADSEVYPRLMPSVNVGTLAGARQAIFEAGGLPAKPFATKVLMTASALVDGDYAMVTDGGADNGLYLKTVGAWVKSAYDPLGNAKNYIDSHPVVNAAALEDKNLDLVKAMGVYIQSSATGKDLIALKYPVPNPGILRVYSSTSTALVIQEYYDIVADIIYRRIFTTAWGEWSTSKEFITFAESNANFKAKRIDASDNLDDYTTSGDFYKIGSGDISLSNGYPVALAGHLRVDAANVSSMVQSYTVYSTRDVYIRTKSSSSWSVWVKLTSSSEIGAVVDARTTSLKKLEWQALAGSRASYDATTRTVSITGFILAPFENAAGRIRINDISIALPNAYDVCYLDLNKLGKVTDITSDNYTDYIFVGNYSGAGDAQYRAKLGQVALFKYDVASSKVVAAAGFVEIKNTTDGNSEAVKDISNTVSFTKTANLLSVYFPQVSGKQLYVGFNHDVVPADPPTYYQANADLWRLKQIYRCDSDFIKELQIVNMGEVELAITHVEATHAEGVSKDHVGGYHGDELQVKTDFYIDGVRKNQDFTQASITTANEIQAVQHSVIYYQGTSRPLADHVKVVTFKDGVVNIKQKLDFKYEACQLSTAWIAMLPILRTDSSDVQITDRSSRSDDYYLQVDDNTTTAFDFRFTPLKDGSVVKQWLSTGSISSETTVIKTPNFSPTQNIFITNGAGYNKLYVSATDGSVITPHDVPLNTVWEWETEYKIKC